MAKNYKVYKLKYGLRPLEVHLDNGQVTTHKDDHNFMLYELILQSQGYSRIGEIRVKEPTILIMDNDFNEDVSED